MKKYLFSLLILFRISFPGDLFASVSICSWNLMNFGKSKSEKTLEFIAKTLQPFDVIAIEEVVAGNGGAQAVANLAEIMNREGKSRDYCISDPTSTTGHKSERYAFIWDKSKVTRIGNASLEKKYHREIEREPYMATFKKDGRLFTVACFHAITKEDNPETEIKYFKFIPSAYPALNIIFCGDFNCPQSNTVFSPLKSMGFAAALVNQKTTLRNKCLKGDCLASGFDNLFFDRRKINLLESGIVPFYLTFKAIAEARKISDHLPVKMIFEVR